MADNFTPAVKKLLRAAGCRFEHQGNGGHEICYGPISKRRLMVRCQIKSRHWANDTLKQAGLPQAF